MRLEQPNRHQKRTKSYQEMEKLQKLAALLLDERETLQEFQDILRNSDVSAEELNRPLHL